MFYLASVAAPGEREREGSHDKLQGDLETFWCRGCPLSLPPGDFLDLVARGISISTTTWNHASGDG